MLLISSHLDRVSQDFNLAFKKGKHVGLLDNFIGMLVTYLTLYDDKNILSLEKRGIIKFWHNQGEEWGHLYNSPKVGKKDKVLVVDVASGKQYNGYDFSLENISGFSKQEIKDLKESLEWEGFKVLVKWFDGNPDDEDEAWQWAKKKNKVISMIIPIEDKIGWHAIQQNSIVDSKKILICKQGLKRCINYLI